MYENPFYQSPVLPNDASDLTVNQKDYAVFLPSISAMYVRLASMENYGLRDKLPDCFTRGMDDLNFLDPMNHLYYYPAALTVLGMLNWI